MTGRNVYLVAYDVRDPKRLRKIHRALRGFGGTLQFSIFHCELTPKEKQLLIGDVSDIIHHHEDRVLLVDVGPRDGRAKRAIEILGSQHLPPASGPTII